MSGYISKRNGRKCVKKNFEVTIVIPDIPYVFLTPTQYGSLIEKYGYKLLRKALKILNDWLKSAPKAKSHQNTNHFSYFRKDGWVINSAKNDN